MTRFRSTQKAHIPILPLVGQYYAQRSSRPGTLLISEAALISPIAGGFDNAPGIWNESHISSWKEVSFRRVQLSVAVELILTAR